MSIVLVTGGAKSGKSSFAERQLQEKKSVAYIATNVPRFPDSEMDERVRRHRAQRNERWHTEERFLQIAEYLNKTATSYEAFLLDCVTILTTNLFFHYAEEITDSQSLDSFEDLTLVQLNQLEERIYLEWDQILAAAGDLNIEIWLVTNEVGMGIVPERRMGRWFQDILGKVNQKIGQSADEVYFVVCGIPQKIK